MTMAMAAQEVKERPIIFGAWKLRRILEWNFERDGDMQTRRVISEQKRYPHLFEHRAAQPRFVDFVNPGGVYSAEFIRGDTRDSVGNQLSVYYRVPYGRPGDRLWVREAWRTFERRADSVDGILFPADRAFIPIENAPAAAEAWVVAHDNGKHGANWRPPIFMPRWASRLTLEITSVRVERLLAITEEDAKREGAPNDHSTGDVCGYYATIENTYRRNFALAWDGLNKRRGFGTDKNPWVWVLSFKRL